MVLWPSVDEHTGLLLSATTDHCPNESEPKCPHDLDKLWSMLMGLLFMKA